METSAKDGRNVQEMFRAIGEIYGEKWSDSVCVHVQVPNFFFAGGGGGGGGGDTTFTLLSHYILSYYSLTTLTLLLTCYPHTITSQLRTFH